ncbi:IclR family transcriptional regulator [Enterococcus sp. 2201sp1_2201st1_B8_2201SCRN_220225]|uniref:IclR family transcriptional regulator n=1 Tax=unclassified Enterococcus TaxID=2608891 RepID=UPI0034A330D9
METQKPYGTVLVKASYILDYLAGMPNSSLQEIAKGTQLTSSTALKILDTLILIGYVEKSIDKNYRLGTRLIRYANHDLAQNALVETTQLYLELLNEEVDETIHLGVLATDEILYLNKIEPKRQTILMSSKIGITRPLYSSAMGKAVLAEFTSGQYRDYLEKTQLVPYTPNTITNPLKLADEIQQVKTSKVAFDDEEMEKDIFCVGATIMTEGELQGAFSVSMPKYRLTPEFKEKVVRLVLETKSQIEEQLQSK